jgi:hypothetical protein
MLVVCVARERGIIVYEFTITGDAELVTAGTAAET